MTTPSTPDPELRERIAFSLAAGDTGSGAHWSDMDESMQDMYRRYADHALMPVQPELERLRAESHRAHEMIGDTALALLDAGVAPGGDIPGAVRMLLWLHAEQRHRVGEANEGAAP